MTTCHSLSVATAPGKRALGYAIRKMELGRAIRSQRLSLGLSEATLAERVVAELERRGEADPTLTQSAVSYWEKGRSAPERYKLAAIEAVMQFDPGELGAILDERPRSGSGNSLADLPAPAALAGTWEQLTAADRRIVEELAESLLRRHSDAPESQP